MPWDAREIRVAAEEFRVTALQAMGEEWLTALPTIPRTKKKGKGPARRQRFPGQEATIPRLGGKKLKVDCTAYDSPARRQMDLDGQTVSNQVAKLVVD